MLDTEDKRNNGGVTGSGSRLQGETPVSGERKGRMAVRRIGVLAAAAAVLICMEAVAQRCFDSAHYADYYNYDLKTIEEENEDVGMVIAGASQVYHGCDTSLLADEMGYDNVIDASTAGQVADGTYYLLLDVLDRFDPEYVIVGLSWDRFFPKKTSSLNGGRLLTADRLSFSEKLGYFLKCAPVGQWFNLSSLYRFGHRVTSISQLESNYTAKKQAASGSWVTDTAGNSYYGKNGYVVYPRALEEGHVWAEELTFDESLVSEHELEYFNKIAELCRERGKKLIWMTIPTTLSEIYSIDNYQFAVDYMTEFFESTGCPYLNFSMLKNREELLPDTVFSDHIHLNQEGSQVFSKILADTVKRLGNGEDVSDMFYSSVEDMKKDVHRIVGSYLSVIYKSSDGTCTAYLRSHQNDDIIPQYRLSRLLPDGSWEVISDWQNETVVELPAGLLAVGDTVMMEVRQQGQENIESYWTKNVALLDDTSREDEVFDE